MKILWVLLVLLDTNLAAVKNSDVKRGPYRSVLVSIRNCHNATYPFEKDPPIGVTMWTSGNPRTRLLNGNITVVRDTKQVRMKMRIYTWVNGKWKLTLLVNGGCQDSMMQLICRVISSTILDPVRCAIMKGTYTFNDLDINTMHHLFTSKMEYGQTLWRSEVNVGFSTYQCFDLHTLVERV